MRPTITTATVAIHGVGNHKQDKIREALERNLRAGAGFSVRVHEFNWDQFVDHSASKNPARVIWRLERTAFDIQAAGLAGIAARDKGIDANMARLQLLCCNILRYAVATFLTLFTAFPAMLLVVYLPSALAEIDSPLPDQVLSWFTTNVVPSFLLSIGALCASVVILGVLRCFAQQSSVSLRYSIVAVALMIINPILILLSVPFSLRWASLNVVLLFISVCSLIFFLVSYLLNLIPHDEVPFYSIWKEYGLAVYPFSAVSVILLLQMIYYFFRRAWFAGPIKVVLDIFRYLAEPKYRGDILGALDDIIKKQLRDTESLLIVAHSLGSVIALDYLLNRLDQRPKTNIWLVTLGSPYRRFFVSLFPRLFFHRETNATAAAIARKCHSFHWLNVYRPWDPIGTSLGLGKASAGLDVSTRQWQRINGHINYWDDPAVMDRVSPFPKAFEAVPAPIARVTEQAPRIPAPVHLPSPPNSWLSKAHFLFVGLGVLWMIYAISYQASEIKDMKQRIDHQGVHVSDVYVAHQEIGDAAGPPLYAHQFDFTSATVSDIPIIQVSPFQPASRAQKLFDYRKLIHHVRSNCKLERKVPWYIGEEQIRCVSNEPIELRYLPGSQKPELYLPDFEARVYLRDLDGWIIYPLTLFLFLSIPGFPFSAISAAVFLIFLGREVETDLREKLPELEHAS